MFVIAVRKQDTRGSFPVRSSSERVPKPVTTSQVYNNKLIIRIRIKKTWKKKRKHQWMMKTKHS